MDFFDAFLQDYGTILRWIGIGVCLSQSATFSGLNLAVFSLNRLQLEVEEANGSKAAKIALEFRKDSNFLLCTILWGNVGINVLLTLVTDSLMAGATAFLFSTVAITLCGEIFPQAYFSRNAMAMTQRFSPILKFYQFVLYPVARPTAFVLDRWIGREGVEYMRERDLKAVLMRHTHAEESEVEKLEGIGALNFLDIDSIAVREEGEVIVPDSIIALPTMLDLPVIPELTASAQDPFIRRIHKSRMKWVVLTNEEGDPLLVLDADGFLRAVLFEEKELDAYAFCHRPIIIKDAAMPLGDAIWRMKKVNQIEGDDVIDRDLILYWGEEKRIITGADILGRLLDGTTAGELKTAMSSNDEDYRDPMD